MSNFSTLNYLSKTAVQLAMLPQGLWSLAKNGTLPRVPNKDDGATGIVHTIAGSVLGAGISAFAQNIAAKGALAALTGSRLGWTELNWSSMGSAVLVGAAIGASIGIATYLAREGNNARVLSKERNSPTSQTNVSLKKMAIEGPDPWAIKRILEKDPKAILRIEAATLEHTMNMTHTGSSQAKVHATIALAAAMMARTGELEDGAHQVKQDWMGEKSVKLVDSPSAQLLLNTLTKMPPIQRDASVLDMHSSWATMLSKQMQAPNIETFEAELSKWNSNYFEDSSTSKKLAPTCYAVVTEMAKNPGTAIRVHQEAAQTDAMVASMLLDVPVAVKKVEAPVFPAYSAASGPAFG